MYKKHGPAASCRRPRPLSNCFQFPVDRIEPLLEQHRKERQAVGAMKYCQTARSGSCSTTSTASVTRSTKPERMFSTTAGAMRKRRNKTRSMSSSVSEFDDIVWNAVLDHMTIYSDCKVVFIFRDGTELPWTIKKEVRGYERAEKSGCRRSL